MKVSERRKRSKLEIIGDILEQARKPTNKTRIMYECNLSFEQLKRYLRFVQLRGLIETKEKDGIVAFQTTRSGRRFLELFDYIVLLLRA